MSLESAYISHQIWLQRTGSHLANQSIPFVQQMRDEVSKRVLAMGDDNRTAKRLNSLTASLDDLLTEIASDWQNGFTSELKYLASYETEWNNKTLSAFVDYDFVTPSPNQVWSAILFNPLSLEGSPKDFDKLLTDWKEVEVNRLTMSVKSGFVQGLTTREIVKMTVGKGGLAEVSQRNAATTVRTAVAHVSSVTRQSFMEKNSDVIERYQWISTLDSRTSNICRHRDGMKFIVGEGPLPPAHPNCRSGTIPLVSSAFDFLDEGAKRAARGAYGGIQVDANTTYYDFLKSQPAWFQDESLGPVRGAIFRNSGLTPEEFRSASVDGFGRPLTIQQMADLDSRVADYLKSKS